MHLDKLHEIILMCLRYSCEWLSWGILCSLFMNVFYKVPAVQRCRCLFAAIQSPVSGPIPFVFINVSGYTLSSVYLYVMYTTNCSQTKIVLFQIMLIFYLGFSIATLLTCELAFSRITQYLKYISITSSSFLLILPLFNEDFYNYSSTI